MVPYLAEISTLGERREGAAPQPLLEQSLASDGLLAAFLPGNAPFKRDAAPTLRRRPLFFMPLQAFQVAEIPASRFLYQSFLG